jgi:hypothetical protein
MGSAVLADAARVKPPSAGNNNEGALAAGVVVIEQDLFAGQGDSVMHHWISLTCTAPFNYITGKAGLADPTDIEYFAGGAAVQFRATRSQLAVLLLRMPAGGNWKWWVSGP